MLEKIGYWLARHLEKESSIYTPMSVVPHQKLRECLRPGDILLVEGNMRISVAIKYLTQSTWSHAALYVGDKVDPHNATDPKCLIEADIVHGIVAVPLSKYASLNIRICRPVRLTSEDRESVISYAIDRLGRQYDMKNAIDLMRYLLPQPPAPVRWRRKMLSFGSGDPTRAICTTLIAGAYRSINYPILPDLCDGNGSDEVCHIRNTSLFVPRDFDLSPYFQVVKPLLENGFDYRQPYRPAKVQVNEPAHDCRQEAPA